MKVLLSEEQLSKGVRDLAEEINSTYGNQPLTIVGLLTGSIILLADVIRLLRMPLRVGVLQTSSYRTGTERGNIQINSSLMLDVTGRDVLLVDDIFDTGHTLKEVSMLLQEFEPSSIKSAVLLQKTGCQEVELRPNFVVFEIPDQFVVGYGLDYCDQYRNLPYVAAMEPADIKSTCP